MWNFHILLWISSSLIFYYISFAYRDRTQNTQSFLHCQFKSWIPTLFLQHRITESWLLSDTRGSGFTIAICFFFFKKALETFWSQQNTKPGWKSILCCKEFQISLKISHHVLISYQIFICVTITLGFEANKG